MQQIIVAYEARMKLVNDVLKAVFPRKGQGAYDPDDMVDFHDGAAVRDHMLGVMAQHNARFGQPPVVQPDGTIVTSGAAPL